MRMKPRGRPVEGSILAMALQAGQGGGAGRRGAQQPAWTSHDQLRLQPAGQKPATAASTGTAAAKQTPFLVLPTAGSLLAHSYSMRRGTQCGGYLKRAVSKMSTISSCAL